MREPQILYVLGGGKGKLDLVYDLVVHDDSDHGEKLVGRKVSSIPRYELIYQTSTVRMSRLSYLNAMEGIEEVIRYHTLLTVETISEAVHTAKGPSHIGVRGDTAVIEDPSAICIGTLRLAGVDTELVEASTSFQFKTGIQVMASIVLPGEQGCVLKYIIYFT